jgi:hypothetical protein
MSKTVTIPTCRNPFEVTVNNKTYTYTAGETVEVPDEVAEVIEAHISAEHTKAPQESAIPRTGGGGSATWELVGEVVSDGNGDASGISVPIDFTKYTEVYICANKLAKGDKNRRVMVREALQWYAGSPLTAMTSDGISANAYSNEYMISIWLKVIAGTLRGHWTSNTGYSAGVVDSRQIESPRGFISASYIYISLDTNGNGVVPEGETLTVYAR